MKNAVTTLTAIVLLGNVLVTEAREMGHYAPGVVSIRDLADPSLRARVHLAQPLKTKKAT